MFKQIWDPALQTNLICQNTMGSLISLDMLRGSHNNALDNALNTIKIRESQISESEQNMDWYWKELWNCTWVLPALCLPPALVVFRKIIFSFLSVCLRGWSPCDHYPWCHGIRTFPHRYHMDLFKLVHLGASGRLTFYWKAYLLYVHVKYLCLTANRGNLQTRSTESKCSIWQTKPGFEGTLTLFFPFSR